MGNSVRLALAGSGVDRGRCHLVCHWPPAPATLPVKELLDRVAAAIAILLMDVDDIAISNNGSFAPSQTPQAS